MHGAIVELIEVVTTKPSNGTRNPDCESTAQIIKLELHVAGNCARAGSQIVESPRSPNRSEGLLASTWSPNHTYLSLVFSVWRVCK